MKVAVFDCYIDGEPIWKYERKDGVYMVRDRGKCSNGTNHFVVKSPTGRLYTFYEYSGSEEEAINDIMEMRAEGADFFSCMESIYEEI